MNLIRASYQCLENLGNAYADTIDRMGNALRDAEGPRRQIAQLVRNSFCSLAAAALVTTPFGEGLVMAGSLSLFGVVVANFVEDPAGFQEKIELFARSSEFATLSL